jgi:hypothetical protein
MGGLAAEVRLLQARFCSVRSMETRTSGAKAQSRSIFAVRLKSDPDTKHRNRSCLPAFVWRIPGLKSETRGTHHPFPGGSHADSKASLAEALCGTAEAVPFVRRPVARVQVLPCRFWVVGLFRRLRWWPGAEKAAFEERSILGRARHDE